MGGPNRTEDIDFVKWKREFPPPSRISSPQSLLKQNKKNRMAWCSCCKSGFGKFHKRQLHYKTSNINSLLCYVLFCFVSFRCFHFYWMCVRVRRYTCELWLGISFIHTAPHTLTPLVFSKILLLLTAYLFDVILLWLLLFSYFFSSTIKNKYTRLCCYMNAIECEHDWESDRNILME